MLSLASIFGTALLVYRNPDGTVGWRKSIRNGVTYQGVNWWLDTAFIGIAQVQAVRMGIIAQTGYTDVSVNDTHSSHSGWLELASVSGTTRAVWQPQASSSGTMGTLVPAHVTFVGSGLLRGVFLSTISTIGSLSAAGVLYNTAVAVTPLAYADGGTLDVSFTPRVRE